MDNIHFEVLLAIINSTYNAIVAVDKSAKIILINKAAERIIGVKAEEAVGQHIKDIIPNTGLLDVLMTNKGKKGRKIIINDRTCVSNLTPIIRNKQIWGAVAIFQDISDMEEISTELKEYQQLAEQLNAVVESSSDGIYICDNKGYTIRINSAYERITGIKNSEVVGRHVQELVQKGFFSSSVTLLVLEKKRTVTIMQQMRNGKEVIVTGNPVIDDHGRVVLVANNVRDITELKKLQEKLNHAKALTNQYHKELNSISYDNCIIKSPVMINIIEYAKQIAPFPTSVLLHGDSGVGKEVIATFIHENSKRAEKPFIKVNCGAIPEQLLESELFGYEAGAFTGAQKSGKPGLFEMANEGTILLDEIGELPINLQVKLLRVLQEGTITRLGGVKPRKLNVRIISATNKDLLNLVKYNKFRNDLYYRLNVIKIKIPPLRDRQEDILPLAQFYLEKFCKSYGLEKIFSQEVKECFQGYDWPGNIRELKNLIENLVVSSKESTLNLSQLPNSMINNRKKHFNNANEKIIPIKEAVEKLEAQLIQEALAEQKTIRGAAKVLGIDHSTLSRKIGKLGIKV